MKFISDKTYIKIDREELFSAEYENCVFQECDFSAFNFKGYKFIDCSFESCNLSLMNVSQCSLQTVRFQECKMVGILFEQVNPFSLELSFDDCNLSQC